MKPSTDMETAMNWWTHPSLSNECRAAWCNVASKVQNSVAECSSIRDTAKRIHPEFNKFCKMKNMQNGNGKQPSTQIDTSSETVPSHSEQPEKYQQTSTHEKEEDDGTTLIIVSLVLAGVVVLMCVGCYCYCFASEDAQEWGEEVPSREDRKMKHQMKKILTRTFTRHGVNALDISASTVATKPPRTVVCQKSVVPARDSI